MKFSDLTDHERSVLLSLAKPAKQRLEEARRYIGQKSIPSDVIPADGYSQRLVDEDLIEYIEMDDNSLRSYPGALIVTDRMGHIARIELTEKGRELLANAVIES